MSRKSESCPQAPARCRQAAELLAAGREKYDNGDRMGAVNLFEKALKSVRPRRLLADRRFPRQKQWRDGIKGWKPLLVAARRGSTAERCGSAVQSAPYCPSPDRPPFQAFLITRSAVR